MLESYSDLMPVVFSSLKKLDGQAERCGLLRLSSVLFTACFGDQLMLSSQA
jgi:hypothetical protein